VRTLHISFGAVTAALVIAGTAVALLPGDVAAAPAALSVDDGVQYLNTQVNLPNGVWSNTPLVVHLPDAGTYELDANVRGRLSGNPVINTFITARLWNITTGAALPRSERLVYQVIDGNATGAAVGGNATVPISELVTVGGPTDIQVQARDVNAGGTALIAQIYSDSNGYTSLRFVGIG
jgi:hypothetical protein